MKKTLLILSLLLLLSAVADRCFSQTDTNFTLAYNIFDSKYSLVTNVNDLWNVGSSTQKIKLLYSVNSPLDTNAWKLYQNFEDGKYSFARNLSTFWSTDSDKVSAELVYLVNAPTGVSTSADNTWTGTQTFSTLIADLIITNRVDSTTSIRLYDTSGTLYALFSADTSYIPNLTVGNLNSTTIINGSSVTTNSLISDTLISNSPLHLRTDSLFLGVLNDTSKVWYNELLYSSNKRRGVIYPNIDYGMNIGTYNKRVDTVNARSGKFYRLYVQSNDFIIDAGQDLGQFGLSVFRPYSNALSNLGSPTVTWKNTYTRTLNSDTVLSKVLTGGNGARINLSDVNSGMMYFNINSYSAGLQLLTGLFEPSTNLGISLGRSSQQWLKIWGQTLNVDSARVGKSIYMSSITEPTSPTAGQIYFNGTNFYGYNGTIWKQLDN